MPGKKGTYADYPTLGRFFHRERLQSLDDFLTLSDKKRESAIKAFEKTSDQETMEAFLFELLTVTALRAQGRQLHVFRPIAQAILDHYKTQKAPNRTLLLCLRVETHWGDAEAAACFAQKILASNPTQHDLLKALSIGSPRDKEVLAEFKKQYTNTTPNRHRARQTEILELLQKGLKPDIRQQIKELVR